MSFEIRADIASDYNAIDQINDLAFGETEQSRIIRELRQSGDALWSNIGILNGQPIAHVQIYRVLIDDKDIAIGLGPVSVLPAFQKQGYGSALIRAGLAETNPEIHQAIFVLGHVDYYPRFGFRSDIGAEYISPWPRPAFMGMRLSYAAPRSGTLKFPQAYL
jgi:putative acetyltransferase